MSFAAFVSEVLEGKDAVDEQMPVDYLSMICALVVKESLANVFGNKFDFFARNFEKSFGSTLRTLRLINQSDINKGSCHINLPNAKDSAPFTTHNERVDHANCCDVKCCSSETDLPTTSIQNGVHITEGVEENVSADCLSQELAVNGPINHIAHAPSSFCYVTKQLYAIEKSAMEQARANDLKTLEIGLAMKKLKLKREQLDLSFDSNDLERSKLAMGRAEASFKTEKFKTQLEDARHAELLRKCLDCLVAGLFVMSASLLYGAYVYSYKKITEATMACNSTPEARVTSLAISNY
uniref:Uncharacterized protein n=1 Tax=Rhizophora mucronata TaxID=61149 RepID=A0A2P2JMH1_RHIMU